MKKLTLIICVALVAPIAFTSCVTPQTIHNVEVKSVLVVATGVDAGMKVAAQLLKDGFITKAQWDQIAAVHGRYQALLKLTVDAVNGNTSAPSPADLAALAAEVISIINSYRK